MADQTPKFPINAMMQYPDQSQYVYSQVVENFEAGTYIEANHLGRLVKFKGGFRFPQGIIMEIVPADWYTWVMIRPPVEKPKPSIMIPGPANAPEVG